MKKEIFKMPTPIKIKQRTSSITNAFFNGIIPAIKPDDNEIMDALRVLGMDENTICCAYCGDPHTEWDHLNPLVVNKRPTGFISEIHNLIPSCSKCNQSKGNKSWKEWMLGDAPKSPKTRKIPDLEERVQKIEEYEKHFKPIKIDIESIVGKELWTQYLSDLEMLHVKMDKCQDLSDEIKEIISKAISSSYKPEGQEMTLD